MPIQLELLIVLLEPLLVTEEQGVKVREPVRVVWRGQNVRKVRLHPIFALVGLRDQVKLLQV